MLPLIAMLVCLLAGSRVMPVGPDLLVPSMLVAAAVAAISVKRRGGDFAAIQRVTGEKLAAIMPMLLILLAIGMLIGTWLYSGTIPFLIYHGLRLVDPRYLLVTAFLVTAVMSLATGTSFGSAGTVGVALMGMAMVTEVPVAACAGAVLSGAYFGDKMSPLSDTTNICAIGAGAELYAHIRHMVYTAGPSFVVACAVYLIAGSGMGGAGVTDNASDRITAELTAAFPPNWLCLVPPAVAVVAVVRRLPPVPAMTLSAVSAIVVGWSVYGFAFGDGLAAAVNGFRVEMLGTTSTGEALTTLVNRGGIFSMVGNFVMIIAAFLLAAGMEVSGGLEKIMTTLLGWARGAFGLVAATMAAGGITIAMTSHGGVTALIVGNLFQGAYDQMGFARVNLSRSLEDSVTITEPLMPWTVSALFMAGTLGVATLDYLPWAVFCYSGTVGSLVLAALYRATGFGLARVSNVVEAGPP